MSNFLAAFVSSAHAKLPGFLSTQQQYPGHAPLPLHANSFTNTDCAGPSGSSNGSASSLAHENTSEFEFASQSTA